ncbi:MAG: hypothetical protein CFK49_05595 [Armatimonadetes bacterium JP3_11]|nr:MAG: hypothetical protein CFK49_05595 [Armatimonadetes bacterium JP3_11]RMH06304.1 MAG: hypothetical protein D6697_10885 [Armatimonadota bacterium]
MDIDSIKRWWRAFFAENPVVWLLRRAFLFDLMRSFDTRTSSVIRQYEQAVRRGDWEQGRTLFTHIAQHWRIPPLPQPFWLRGDRSAFLWMSLASLLLLGALWWSGWWGVLRGQTLVLEIVLAFVNILPFVYASLPNLLIREHANGTSVFLRLTRLNGRDFLRGAYAAYVVGGVLRLYLSWGAPLLIPLMYLIYGSLGVALGVYLQIGLCLAMMGVLWQVLMGLCAVQRMTLLWMVIFTLIVAVAFLSAWLGGALVVGISQASGGAKQLSSMPIWGWALQPVFWASVVFPGGCILLAPLVMHPLWGIVQAVFWVGAWRMLEPLAVRRLQRMLNAPEPEPQSQEGAWW